MKYYIIQTLDGSRWLPHARNRNNTSAELTGTKPPRLFTNKGSALQALQWWREGIHYTQTYSATWANPELSDVCSRPSPGRREEELEIIEIELKRSTQCALFH